MLKINLKNNKGFTLIETLIYVAILGVIAGTFSFFVITLNNARLHSQVVLEVNAQGANLLRMINQSIRNAKAINAPTIGNSAGVLSITTASSSTNPTTYSVGGEMMYLVEGTSSPIALTNNRVKVTNLIFSNISRPATPGTIKIQFTLSNTASTTKGVEQYSADFFGSASVR